MKRFEAGQKVRYLEETDTLRQGETYTVSSRHSNDKGIRLEGFESRWWYDYRFELAEPVVPVPAKPRTPEEVRADRRKELLDAIVAHHSAGLEIAQDWLVELAYGR